MGFSYQYDVSMDMRSQLVLFVDNPLDFLLVSRGPGSESHEGFGLPWGGIPCLPALPVSEGGPRFMKVTAAGPEAVAVQK